MQHQAQAAGAWDNQSLLEQLANIGSEVSRTLTWQEKGNEQYCQLAFNRSLELLDLTIGSDIPFSKRKELCRAREAWIDLIKFDNSYQTTPKQWRQYFDQFLIALRLSTARKEHGHTS